MSDDEKKVKYHGVVCPYMNDFQLKINTRQKSGNAVACASVAPVRLLHLICHKGINTWQILQRGGGMGGGDLITLLAFELPFWGLFLEEREDIPKNNF